MIIGELTIQDGVRPPPRPGLRQPLEAGLREAHQRDVPRRAGAARARRRDGEGSHLRGERAENFAAEEQLSHLAR